MTLYLAVAAGGALGALARYGAMTAVARLAGFGFPYGTLTVNVVGSFLMGVLAEWLAQRSGTPQEVRALLAVGLLGGFTTFSSFSLDVVTLLERQAYLPAGLYVMASVTLSVLGLFAGLYLLRS